MFLKKGLFRFKAIGVAVGVVGLLLSAVVDGGSASGWSCGSSWPTVEAECATLAGAIVVEADAGASGGAELGGWDYSGSATVVLNAPFAGVYDVQVRTHAPYGAATRTLSVNGSVRSFAVTSPSRGVVTVGSVSLVAGANNLVFSKAATDNNVANLDAVTAVAQTPPSTTVATTVPGATTVPLVGCGGSVWPSVEAECGLLSGAIVVEANAAASGGKELGGWDYSGTVAVGLSAPAAGAYDLQVVMFAPYGAATRSLSVNGVSRVVSVLSATRGTVTVSAVPLVAGSNTLVFSRAVSDNNVVNLDKISAVLSGGTPPPTTIGGVTSTVPTSVAAAGTCVLGDAGGMLIFDNGFGSGWTDGSWDTPASLTPTGGVAGSVGLTASRDQWKAIALNSTDPGGGVDVISFALKGTGNWRVQGFENGVTKGFASVTATASWQTFNCRLNSPIVTGPVWISFSNTDTAAQTITVDNVKLASSGTTAPPTPGPAIPVIPMTAGQAAPGTCSVGDEGGTVVFDNSYASGWADSSWSGVATFDATGGVGGTPGLSASRAQWNWIGIKTAAPGAGVDTISFSVKGSGEWQLQGYEDQTVKGSPSFSVANTWQTFNCRLDSPVVGGPLWFAFQNVGVSPESITIDNIRVSKAAVNVNAGRIVANTSLGTGFVATPTVSAGNVSAPTSFVGEGLNGADAIRFDVTAAAAFGVKLTNEAGTVSYVDTSFAAGNVIHWLPLQMPLTPGRVKLTITPTSGTITLKSVDLKNNPFVNITVGAATTSSITATLGAFPETGLSAFLRAIPADQANNCQTCGVTIPVTAAGAYTLNGLGAGPWRLVMYTNSPQETIGTSLDFTIALPVAAPVTTVPAPTTTKAAVTFPSFPGNEYHLENGGGSGICQNYEWNATDGIRADAWNLATLRYVGQRGYAYFTGSEITYTDGTVTKTVSAGANFAPSLYLAADYQPVPLDDIPTGASVTGIKFRISSCPFPGYPYQMLLTIPSSTGVAPPTILPPVGPPTPPAPVSPVFDRNSNYLRSAYKDWNTTTDICLNPSGANTQVGACSNGTTPIKNLSFEEVATNQFRIHPSNDGTRCLQIGNKNHPVQQDPTQKSMALISEWGTCNGQPANAAGKVGYLDELFTFSKTRDGWYTIKPAQNAANWADPCLSIWAKPGGGVESGAVTRNGYDAPVIQFSCQTGNPAWQEWAPVETPGANVTNSCNGVCAGTPIALAGYGNAELVTVNGSPALHVWGQLFDEVSNDRQLGVYIDYRNPATGVADWAGQMTDQQMFDLTIPAMAGASLDVCFNGVDTVEAGGTVSVLLNSQCVSATPAVDSVSGQIINLTYNSTPQFAVSGTSQFAAATTTTTTKPPKKPTTTASSSTTTTTLKLPVQCQTPTNATWTSAQITSNASQALADSLRAAGFVDKRLVDATGKDLSGEDAHHIVQTGGSRPSSVKARTYMVACGIPPNSWINGAWTPRRAQRIELLKKDPGYTTAVHPQCGEYYKEVGKRLDDLFATGRPKSGEVTAALAKIRTELYANVTGPMTSCTANAGTVKVSSGPTTTLPASAELADESDGDAVDVKR
jgi:hypothetical protein